jgi:hypothetical protein
MKEICRTRDRDHRPARAAIEGVRSGRYRSIMCVGPQRGCVGGE